MIRFAAVKQAISTCLLGIFICGFAYASVRERTITQFVHTAWSEKDGAPGNIRALAQTPDGFLWIGADNGLYRFDGINFEHYEPPSGPALPSAAVYALLAPPNGDLWVGFSRGGISLLRHGQVVKYTRPAQVLEAPVWCLAQDDTGRIWAGTGGGLARFDGGHWIEVGKDWKFPGGLVKSLFVDRQGTLWVAAENAIAFLPKGARAFQPTSIQVGTVAQVTQAPNGKLWMAETTRSVRPIPLGTTALPSDETEVRVGSRGIRFVRGGDLWITTLGDGLRRVHSPEALRGKPGRFDASLESYTAQDGLTDNVASCILQDREDNIWVGTMSGLDRFHKSSFTPIVPPTGIYNAVLVPADDGDLWVLGDVDLARVHGFKVQILAGAVLSLRLNAFEVAYRDPTGAIWWVTSKELLYSRKDRFTRFPLPEGLADAYAHRIHFIELSMDRHGILWMDMGHEGLFYRKADTWYRFETPPELRVLNPTAAYTDDGGHIWFGFDGGTIIYLEDGKIRTMASGRDSPVGDVSAIRGHNQQIWIGGATGLAFFDGKRLQAVGPSDDVTFGHVSGMEETVDGSLWLRVPSGVIHINPGELNKFLESPTYRVHYQLFDSLDGLPGKFGVTGWQGEALDGTGRLWFAASKGIASLNPASIPWYSPPQPAAITAVIADGKRFPSQDNPTLPPLTGRLEIDFTGLNLSKPEGVHYRYELEGTDKGWQNAASSHQAFYTNLDPGKHRFRVNAKNVGGEWNAQDTVMVFSIAPAWFQTIWFRAFCSVLALFIVWTLYRMRIRQVANSMSVRFNERTRIARDLHDTLLQSFQGSVFEFQAVRKLLSTRPEEAKAVLDGAIGSAQAAIAEGREAILGLRSGSGIGEGLPDLLRTVGRQCLDAQSGREAPPAFEVTVEGPAQPLAAILQDELYRISQEILRNAFHHAHAKRIEVEMRYSPQELRLRIRDDGVGIDPKVLDLGVRPGHWGLPGMRERAKLIGARFDLWSEAAAGTEVQITVPASVAYLKHRRLRSFRLLRKRARFYTD